MSTELEIVTPDRILLSRAVAMVVIPAAEGEMGVLPGHAPAIVLLRGGTIRLYDGARVTDQFFVSGGFAEIASQRCTVLATEVIPVAEVSRSTAERRLADARAGYDAADKLDMVAVNAAMAHLQAATAMLQIAEAVLTTDPLGPCVCHSVKASHKGAVSNLAPGMLKIRLHSNTLFSLLPKRQIDTGRLCLLYEHLIV